MIATSDDEVRALARRFAAALRHLRDTHDMHYVGARPITIGVASSPAAEPTSHAEVSSIAASEPSSIAVSQPIFQPTPPADRRGARTGDDTSPSSRSNALLVVDTKTAAPEVSEIADKSVLRERAAGWSAATKLDYLRRKNVGDCRRCSLCRTRTNIVFGVGNPEADLMFVGEAPGADEDQRGEPFVGRAGQRLNEWIEAIGLRREDVYIANVLKCRPPGNRDPRPDETDRCAPFLKAQIRAIEPKVIVALGRHAGMLLANRDDLTLRAMRTQRLFYDASASNDSPGTTLIPLIVTYHPAYVLRQEGPGSDNRSESRSENRSENRFENRSGTRSGENGPATQAVLSDLKRALQLVAAPAR